ncbi:hypothetical protein B566_EDAN002717 [Ephemera danica]|nr:hypothetical protein B566_EDAN002717 [Ephemera danica]
MDSLTEDPDIIGINKWSTTNTPRKPSATAGMKPVTPPKSDEARDSMDIKKDIQPVCKDKQAVYTPIFSGADTQTDLQANTVDKPLSVTSPQETDSKPSASISVKQEPGLDPNLSLQGQAVIPQTTTSTILVKKTYTKLSQGVETRPNINIGAHIKIEKPGSSTIKSRISYKKPVTLNLSKMPKCFVLLEKLEDNQMLLNSTTPVVKTVIWKSSVVTSGEKKKSTILTPDSQGIKRKPTVLTPDSQGIKRKPTVLTIEMKLKPTVLTPILETVKQEVLDVTPMDIKEEPGLVATDILEVKQGSSEQILRCDKCGVKFDTMGELIDHNVSHVKKTDTATSIKSCPICSCEVFSMAHLHIHMKSHYSVNIKSEDKAMLYESSISQDRFQTTYFCDLCNKNYKSRPLLLSHFKSGHRKIYRSPDFKLAKRFICTICGKMYRGHHSASDHVARNHLPLMGHKLPIKIVCVRFTDNDLNVNGFLSTSLSKSFSCKICGINLGCKQKAAMHMLDVHCNAK